MEWSLQDALNAYLHTLQLTESKNDISYDRRSTALIEPKIMEFISALAAGKRARLMVEVSTHGITPLTIALAVAAKQTGGKLICILLSKEVTKKGKVHFNQHYHDLQDVVTGNPCELVKHYRNIDFAVIDGKLEDYLILLKMIDVNPSGFIIVGHNLRYTRYGVSVGQVLNGNKGVEDVTLPIGEGMELTRIGSMKKSENRRGNRFHVTFENN